MSAAPDREVELRSAASPATGCASCGEPLHAGDRFCEACGQRRPDARDRVELDGPGVAAVSDRGVWHHHNEDAVAVCTPAAARGHGTVRLAVVCDGVSRGARPDLASQAGVDGAVEVLVREIGAGAPVDAEEATRTAVDAAAGAVAALARRADADAPPACTFVSVVLVGSRATVASVGDSRVYWVPSVGDGARVLTVDDSWRREAVVAGGLTEAMAARDRRRHAITAWLGADAGELAPRVTTHDLDGPGVLVACSDGLWNTLPDAADLAAAVQAAGPIAEPLTDPLALARHLVAGALGRDERDNVTAAVVVLDEPARAPQEQR